MNQEITTITIPSLTRDYVFFHTSDVHIRPGIDYSDRENAMQVMRSLWKIPFDLLPTEALDEVLRSAEAEHADGVFLCGDLIDSFSPDAVEDLKNRLDGASVELMFVCGNHDRFVNKKPLPSEVCYPVLAPLMHGNPACWVRDFGELLIVGIDNSLMEIQESQLAFLQELSAKNKPILLLMHAPMLTDSIVEPVRKRWGENADGYFLIDKETDTPVTRRFYSFVRSAESNVAAVFAGHIHISHSGEFAPGRMQYTSATAPLGICRKYILTGKR